MNTSLELMPVLTAAEYRERGERNPLGNGIFSFLTVEELNVLKLCITHADTPSWKRASMYHSLACQPVGAMHYCNAVIEAEST